MCATKTGRAWTRSLRSESRSEQICALAHKRPAQCEALDEIATPTEKGTGAPSIRTPMPLWNARILKPIHGQKKSAISNKTYVRRTEQCKESPHHTLSDRNHFAESYTDECARTMRMRISHAHFVATPN